MPKQIGPGIELLADPTRRRIIQLIAVHPRRPSAIAAALGLRRPAVSRQLRLLHEAALIRDLPAYQDGRARVFGLHPDNVSRVVAFLAGTELGLVPDLRPRQARWKKEPESFFE